MDLPPSPALTNFRVVRFCRRQLYLIIKDQTKQSGSWHRLACYDEAACLAVAAIMNVCCIFVAFPGL